MGCLLMHFWVDSDPTVALAVVGPERVYVCVAVECEGAKKENPVIAGTG